MLVWLGRGTQEGSAFRISRKMNADWSGKASSLSWHTMNEVHQNVQKGVRACVCMHVCMCIVHSADICNDLRYVMM